MILLRKILWFPGGFEPGIEITDDVEEVNIRQNIDDGTNDITISLKNSPNRFLGSRTVGKYVSKDDAVLEFNKDKNTDFFHIFLAFVESNRELDTTITSNDLLTVAELREVELNIDENKQKLTLKCEDHTFTIIGRIWTQNYPLAVHTGSVTGITETVLTDSAASFNTVQAGEKGKVIEMTSGTANGNRYLITANTATTLTSEGSTMVTDGVAATDTYEVGWTSASISQDVVRHATDGTNIEEGDEEDGTRNAIGPFAVDARYDFEGGFIQADREEAGGSGATQPFPRTSLAKLFKPVYEYVKEVSQTTATNTSTEFDTNVLVAKRSYRFYVDALNRFHWFYPKDTETTKLNGAITNTDTTITVDSTTGFPSEGRIHIESELIDYTGTTATTFTGCTRGVNNTTATSHADNVEVFGSFNLVHGDTSTGFKVRAGKMTKKVFDIVNNVIYRCGKDMNGNGVFGHWFDENTSLTVLRSVEKPWEDITRDLLKNEKDKTEDDGHTGPTDDGKGWYDYPSNYTDYDGSNDIPIWNPGEVITSDAEFNTSLKTAALEKGRARAQALTQQRATARWSGNVELRGFKLLSGESVLFTSSRQGLYRVQMRIKTVRHKITKTQWVTTIDVEEDEAERTV